MSVAIYFGTTTGVTEEVVEILKNLIPQADVHDVKDGIDGMEDYDFLILCSSTWGLGDLQDDWMYVLDEMPSLKEKPVAILGTGDAIAYADTFVDAMRTMYDKCKKLGAKIVGRVDPSNYDFVDSVAIIDGKFIGLPIDHINEPEKTEERLEKWVESLNKYLGAL